MKSQPMILRSAAWLGMLACSLCASSGCAVLSKSEPFVPRYFTPELASADNGRTNPVAPTGSQGNPSGRGEQGLRLGRVHAAEGIRDKIMLRNSDYEVVYSDELRWTETPDVYLRRALSHKLFEERGIRRVVSGPAPTLDVELLAFEQVRVPHPAARIRVSVSLSDDRISQFEHTFTVERPMTTTDDSKTADAFVRAMAEALPRMVEQITDDVQRTLSTMRPPPAGG